MMIPIPGQDPNKPDKAQAYIALGGIVVLLVWAVCKMFHVI